MLHNSWRRTGAATLAPLVVVGSLLVGLSSPTQATPADAQSAGSWLAGQLDSGLMVNDQYSFTDYGLTLDAYFAFQSAGVESSSQGAILDAVAAGVTNYIDGGPYDAGAKYAGSTAKVLAAATRGGRDATSFGGVDLVSRLESVTDDATGEIADESAYGNYANVLGQAFAVEGLQAAGSSEANAARDFLLDQQCGDGYFTLNFGGACDGSSVNNDATAAAVVALVKAKSDGMKSVSSAIDDGVAWLLSEQASDGSVASGSDIPVPNTNSTGGAGRAFVVTGNVASALKAGNWLKGLQVASTEGKLGPERGAVAYSPEAMAAGKADGITVATRDQWRRATPAAILALTLAEPDPKTVTETVTKVKIKPVPRTTTVTRTVVTPAVSAAAPAPATSAGALGAYLADQLTNGDHVEVKDGDGTFVDYDLTADTVLALRLLGEQPDMVRRGSAFLLDSDSVDALAHGAPYEKKAAYAGPLAKLVITATTSGKETQAAKLADELAALMDADGLFVDSGEFADATTDTERHARAILALTMTGHDVDLAVERLLAAQCEDGGFDASLGADCVEGDPAATGWALQALNAASSSARSGNSLLNSTVDGWDGREKASTEAVTYLQGVVRVDGVVTDGSGKAGPADVGAVASGRLAMGLDTSAMAHHLSSTQAKDGGFGGKESELDISASAAAGLATRSWLTVPSTGLVPAVSLPLAPTADAAPTSTTPAADDDDDISVSPVVAYSVAGAAGLLGLGALGLGGAKLVGRRPGA